MNFADTPFASQPMKLLAAALLATMLGACATQPGTYAGRVAERPQPASEAQRQDECAWILREIGRQQEVAQQQSIHAWGLEVIMVRTALEQNIMALERRGRFAGCFA